MGHGCFVVCQHENNDTSFWEDPRCDYLDRSRFKTAQQGAAKLHKPP